MAYPDVFVTATDELCAATIVQLPLPATTYLAYAPARQFSTQEGQEMGYKGDSLWKESSNKSKSKWKSQQVDRWILDF